MFYGDTDSILYIVVYFGLLIIYSPSIFYIYFSFILCKTAYKNNYKRGRIFLLLSIALPLMVWCAKRVHFEREKWAFETVIRAVPISPKPQDIPPTIVVIQNPGLGFIPECFPNVLISSADPVSDAKANLSYQVWDKRSKDAEKPQLPGRYLILKVGAQSLFWKQHYRSTDHAPYELSLVENTSQKLIALEYPFPKRPPFFPPLLTTSGLLTVSNDMNTDQINKKIMEFIHKQTGC